jgi:hypothetical protein
MAMKKQKVIRIGCFPKDESPVIIKLKGNEDLTYLGRYIKSEAMFLLSLNSKTSDFVSEQEVEMWWYITEHPTIVKEVLIPTYNLK